MNRFIRLKAPFLVATLALAGATAAACSKDEEPVSASACPDDQAFFQSEVWTKVFVAKSCVSCHNPSGAAKATRLLLSQSPDDQEKNYEVVRAFVQGEGKNLLAEKPTGRTGSHGGGVLLEASSDEAKILSTFVARENGDCGAATTAAASLNQRQIRRLTRDEYENTLRDLLGVDETLASALPADAVADGFDNQADALQIGTLFVDKARTNAEEIAKKVELARFVSCTPKSGEEGACVDTAIRTFGERAFRRPVVDTEVARYHGVYDVVAPAEGFEQGMRTVLATMLQSPNFLFRTELGTKGSDGWNTLTPYEIASELSYFLWKSMPDEALFAVARSGELATPEAVQTQVVRMLADGKARSSMQRFVEQWLELDRLPQAVKDEATYPGFDDSLRHDLGEETVAFFDHVARSEGSFRDLLTSNYTFPVGKSAAYYGIAAGADGRAQVEGGRIGILTHASVLAVQSTPASASPVRRGKLVRQKFLCQTIPPPPPGVSAQLAPVAPGLPNRERFTQHSQDPTCAGCHRQMDPIGFGFEGFDGAGKIVQGADVSGEVIGTDATNGTFQGVVDLEAKLADSADAQSCFARLWVRYAYGIRESNESLSLANDAATRFNADGTKIRTLMTALVSADHFFRRRSDADEGVGATPAPTTPGTNEPTPTTPTPTADAGGTSPNLDVSVETVTQGAGYQKNVNVTNTGTTAIDWTVKLPKMGKITTAWNTTYTEVSDGWIFVGMDYNKHLEPGQMTSFGFQAE